LTFQNKSYYTNPTLDFQTVNNLHFWHSPISRPYQGLTLRKDCLGGFLLGRIMSKRFTDTEKWNKPWYREMKAEKRDLWNFLHENCDHAGIIEIDLDRFSFFLSRKVSIEEIHSVLRDFVILDDNKILLTQFIGFQYGELKEHCRPHQSVISRLKSKQAWFAYINHMSKPKGLVKGYDTLFDTLKNLPDTLKEQDKDKDKEQEQEQRLPW